VQYIGAVIPLFKFKHSLLEALISAIHEEQLRPAFMEDERETLQETVNQERFLLKSYIEFLSHPFLSKLLELSE